MSNVTEVLPSNTTPIAGPLLLGYLFNWCLFGVLSVQTYIYYIAFPKDKLNVKLIVFGVYTLEVFQTALVTHDAFEAYASGYGNIEELSSMHLEWLGVPILTGIVSCIVQTSYAYRIYVLSGSKLLGIGVSLISIMQGSAAIVQGAQASIIDKFSVLAIRAFLSCTIWLAGSALCDLIIAGCMTVLLVKRDTGVTGTHKMISRLIHLVVETGILTALAATLDIILFLTFPQESYHACVAVTLAKLYSNTLLVIYNSRVKFVHTASAFMDVDNLSLDSRATEQTGGISSLRFGNHLGPNANLGTVDTWTQIDNDVLSMREMGIITSTKSD